LIASASITGFLNTGLKRLLKSSQSLLVMFDTNGGVTNLDWKSYPIMRFPDLPELDIALINRLDMIPLGAGEGATIPPAASIANAIYDAVGLRLREGPFTPKRVLAAMKKA
jgi:CO/xanthine dehydrogenase Mo-binding subunit